MKIGKRHWIQNAIAAAAAASLMACGGGGGSSGGFPLLPLTRAPAPPPDNGAAPAPAPAPAPGSAPAPSPAPAAISADYRFLEFSQERGDSDTAQKRFDDYVALLNQQGAAGYRYVEGEGGGSIVSFTDRFLMVKDSDTTYSYEYLKAPFAINDGVNEVDALLQQMKDQGAKGMVFLKILAPIGLTPENRIEFAVLYRKDNAANTTYDFTAVPYPATSAGYVAAANQQGANGYRPWATPILTVTGDVRQFFMKDMKSNARYDVRALVSPLSEVGGTVEGARAQIRAQGEQGYRLLKSRYMEDSKNFVFYVRDTTQASTFGYEFLDAPDNMFNLTAANATQANQQTANGLRYLGAPDAPIFFRSSSCTGPLCVTPDETELTSDNG